MPIQWSDDLATGVARIDAQHRDLYALVATLQAAMRANQLERIPEVLDGLRRYAVVHFATEEREMEARAYPGLPPHRRLHHAFVEDFQRRRAALAEGTTVSGVVELSGWLTDWLREHVRREDGRFAAWLRDGR